MQKDCHYYGTYFIARAAGFDDKEARSIAWAAQTVDEMNHDAVKAMVYRDLREKKINCVTDEQFSEKVHELLDNDYKLVTVTTDVDYLGKYLAPKAVSDEGNDLARKMIRYAWVPFHFLPIGKDERAECKFEENKCSDVAASTCYECAILNPSIFGKYVTYISACLKYISIEKHISNTNDDIYYICQTSTKLCYSMLEEAKRYYENNSIDKQERLYRIGICMHVLADTWSHQGFCGSNNMFINHVLLDSCGNDSVWEKNGKGIAVLGEFLNSNLALSPAWTGHGSADCNPDVPGFKYKMKYDYLNISTTVDNKERFKYAFSQMYNALRFIRGCDNLNFDAALDKDIVKKITPNFLSDVIEQNRINSWIETIKNEYQDNKLEPYPNAENPGFFDLKKPIDIYVENVNKIETIAKKIDNADDCLLKFLKVAESHRDFIMTKIGYDGCKTEVAEEFKNEMIEFVKDVFNWRECADNKIIDATETVKNKAEDTVVAGKNKVVEVYDDAKNAFFSRFISGFSEAMNRLIQNTWPYNY